jgi:ribonuclease P protein component
MDPPPRTFPRTHRLSSPLRFTAVYDARVRETRGPIVVYALPNDLGHPRMGLSVSRKVGTAPRRNRIKRLLREAFRAIQHDLPSGYDWVIVVRPHVPLALDDYRAILAGTTRQLHTVWQRRSAPKVSKGRSDPIEPGAEPAK